MDTVLSCDVCDKVFTLKKNLWAHLRKVHQLELKLDNGKIKCSECSEFFSRFVQLRDHLTTVHKKTFEEEVVEFETLQGSLRCIVYNII